MAAKKNNQRWKIILVLILVPLLFAAGYAFSAGGAGEKLRQWFGGEVTAPPDGENEPETSGEPDGENSGEVEPGGEISEPPDKEGEGNSQEAEDPDKTPVIFIGQRLSIPGAGEGSTASSKVITSGTVAPASGSKQIALTFDSGWEYTHTIPLLEILDRYKIKATFFPRALWLKDHQDLGREIVQRGHTLGNHSLKHPHMNEMSAADIREDIRQSTRIIQNLNGMQPYLFRPPYGEYNKQLLTILGEEGYPYTVMWTIDTLDWNAGNKMNVGGKSTLIDEDFIVNRALNNAANNAIILMHIGGDTAGHLTVPALPRIIEGLRGQGYSFTTVDKMLPPPSSTAVVHTVQKGETLYSIARRYGVSVAQIIETNNL